MSAAAPPQVGVIEFASPATERDDGRLQRVLVDRFAARVVTLPARQMASPEHVRRAIDLALRNLGDLDVLVFVVTGTVHRFVRRSGDLLGLALPSSVPGRPGSTLPLGDLLGRERPGAPRRTVLLCANLAGDVPPDRLVAALPGVSALISAGRSGHDALATALTGVDEPTMLADVLKRAASLAHPPITTHIGRPAAMLTPVESVQDLPSFVLADIAAPDPGSRLDAVVELAAMAGRHPRAMAQLRHFADADPDRSVRDLASRSLRRTVRPTVADLVRAGALPGDIVEAARIRPELPRLIPQAGGWVTMGVDGPRGDGACRPRHQVEVPAYRLGHTVVTDRQYLAFVLATGHPCPDHWAGDGVWSGRDLPVVMVSLVDADRYCAWLTRRLHVLGTIPADQRARLPSEAEWEAAAGSHRGDPYPWGDSDRPWPANTRATGVGAVLPVGGFPAGASASGCLDLIGNVWEWTRSRWGHGGRAPAYGYPYDRHDGREAEIAADESMRFVVRGGAYYYAGECSNSFTRNRMHATDRHPAGGFRVAVSSEGAHG